MPMPKPRKDETQKEFISRCMGDDTMNEDYPENDQRAAVCYTQWRNRNKSEDNMEKKSIQIQLKEDKPGSFIARIAKLNVIDHDKDVTMPGAFQQGKTVLISAYQHGSWMGELPVGKAVIKEIKDEVIAEGEFNLNTASGKEHYEAIKFSAELQEWSYGFKPVEFEMGEQEGQEVRFLKKIEVFEISPVLKGAGKDTATLGIKAENKEGTPYAEQSEAVLAAVTDLLARTKSLADLRRKDGRDLSTANKEKILSLEKSLADLQAEVKTLLTVAEPKQDEARKAYIAFLKIQNELSEVI